MPISGRILDLQGRPVVGAKITRGRIKAEGTEGIDPYLKLLRDDPMRASNHRFAKDFWATHSPASRSSVTTDAEGRFRLTGIGRDRIVEIEVEGPTIQSATITAMTRPSATVSTPPGTDLRRQDDLRRDLRPPHSPGRALTGVVRDKRTKQPLAGVTVCGKGTNARVTHRRAGTVHAARLPQGQELRADGAGGGESSLLRDLPQRARHRRSGADRGRRRVRRRASRCGSS